LPGRSYCRSNNCCFFGYSCYWWGYSRWCWSCNCCLTKATAASVAVSRAADAVGAALYAIGGAAGAAVRAATPGCLAASTAIAADAAAVVAPAGGGRILAKKRIFFSRHTGLRALLPTSSEGWALAALFVHAWMICIREFKALFACAAQRSGLDAILATHSWNRQKPKADNSTIVAAPMLCV
jgi:hypothetical protein